MGNVQVWQIPLDVSTSELRTCFQSLAADEQARSQKFRFEADRRRFIVARGSLRQLLGRCLRLPPESLCFEYGPCGKPSLKPNLGADPWEFNLSHSQDLAVCAVANSCRVGIDLEQIRPLKQLAGLSDRCLSKREQAQLGAGGQARDRDFLQYWTCKEAYLKAIGSGLTQSMQAVEVQLSPPQLLQVPQPGIAHWQLQLLNLPPGYVGALVIEGDAQPHFYRWEQRHEQIQAREIPPEPQ